VDARESDPRTDIGGDLPHTTETRGPTPTGVAAHAAVVTVDMTRTAQHAVQGCTLKALTAMVQTRRREGESARRQHADTRPGR